MTLKGKTALVTGSTSGIGLGIAQVLARAGANIVLNGFGDPAPALAEIARHGVKAVHHPADLSDVAQIEALFSQAGVDLSKPVVTSCGSGITASLLALALAEIGHRRTAVYDGSWSEWGADQSLPIETG